MNNVTKLKPREAVKNADLLHDLSLNDLAELGNQIIKRGDLLLGLVLLEARERFPADREFGKWRSENFSDLELRTATNLINEARYFKDKPDAFRKLPKSVRYIISAPANAGVADDVLNKCLAYVGKVTVNVARALVAGEDPQPKEETEEVSAETRTKEQPTMKTKKTDRVKVGTLNLIKARFPRIGRKADADTEARKEWEFNYGSEIPKTVDPHSEEAQRLITAFEPVYAKYCPEELTAEEEALKQIELSEKELSALDKYKRKLEREKEVEVSTRVYEFIQENLKSLYDKVNKLIRMVDNQEPVFTETEYKIIRGCLHSDRVPAELHEKFDKAFNLLETHKDQLCGLKLKASDGLSDIPRTPEEFIKRRKVKR